MTTQQTIVLGGGCFWCLDAVYAQVKGVLAVECGYTNGHTLSPSYEEVCSGQTGHNEVVRLTFDASVITLEQLLDIFFVIHDPSTFHRQGNDIGSQYRSGIYLTEQAQEARIKAFMEDLVSQQRFNQITTEIAHVHNYTKAENYHQNYFAHHPHQGYCAFVIAPKLAKFKATFSQWQRA